MTSSAAACHTRTFPLQVNQCRLDPAVCGSLLALPLTKTTVGLWDLNQAAGGPKSSSDPVSLAGHKRAVSSLCFSHDEPRLLCSAAEDYLIVWNVRKCLRDAAQNRDARGEVVLPLPGEVSYVSFDADASRVALCVGVSVKVVGVARREVDAELSGHAARVTAAEFCPHYSATLVTASDDRTVIVWDVLNLSLLYQSPVLGAAPLISLAMSGPAEPPRVAVASASGLVKVFDLADDKHFRQLCHVDVGKMLHKHRQSQPRQRQSPAGEGPVVVTRGGASRKADGAASPQGGDAGFSSIESSDAVLSLMYVDTARKHSQPSSSSPPSGKWNLPGSSSHGAVGEVLSAASPVLLLVSAHCAVQVDSRTLEALSVLDFQQPLPSVFQSGVQEVTVGGVGLAGAGQVGDTGGLVLVVGTLFESRVHSIQWQVASGKAAGVGSTGLENQADSVGVCDSSETSDDPADQLSMVASKPLTDGSPLKSEFTLQASSGNSAPPGKNQRGSVVGGGRGKKADPMNQPLTFKSKVRSSGYTQAPRTTMFQPQTSNAARSKLANLSKTQGGRGQSLAAKLSSQEYPSDAGPPSELDVGLSSGAMPSSVTDLRFSGSGDHLACCLSSKTSLVFPAPFGQKDSAVFVGHDSAVNSVRWSRSGKYLLTASNDRSAILWDRVSGESLLAFSSVQNNFKAVHNSEKPKAKEGYSKEVKGAQFYYMDKFVLVIAGNRLYLYKYHLDPTKDDIRRYLTKSKYKLVKQWETVSQNFTALCAANSFYSHLALCAGSNRSVEIYDLNEGRVAHTFPDAHAKPAHAIALNEGSPCTSQPPDAFNVFATSSTLDCVKVWDVRSRRCVVRLQGHANQALGCGIAFSPCGTYLGSGSEDKLAYVYDLRQGTFCRKLRGHTEVVSSVAFHPGRPLMATGATDGKVLLFKA